MFTTPRTMMMMMMMFILIMMSSWVGHTAQTKIRTPMLHSNNNNSRQQQLHKAVKDNYNNVKQQQQQKQQPALEEDRAPLINEDFINKMSWKCANNATCLYSLATSLITSYKRGETINFGIISLTKLPTVASDTSSSTTTADNQKSKSSKWWWLTSNGGLGESGKAFESSRSISAFIDFIGGNAIRIPFGPMVFSVQRATDDSNYIEVALLKKNSKQARFGDDIGGGDGGGGGGGGGGLGGGGGFRRRKQKSDDKKEMQMFIPMYLAATTFGWSLLAIKAVALLTLKALALSKIAFMIAALMIIKKLVENNSEKMMYHYPEQSSYMMPYSMDYSMHSMPSAPVEMSSNDIYSAAMPMAAAAAPALSVANHGPLSFEHFASESNIHTSSTDTQNATQQLLPSFSAASLGTSVKRTDRLLDKWFKQRPQQHNYHLTRTKIPQFFKTLYSGQANQNLYRNYGKMAARAAAEVVVEEEAFRKHLLQESDEDD